MFIRSCQLVATGFQSVYKFVHSIQYVTDVYITANFFRGRSFRIKVFIPSRQALSS